MKKLLVLAVVAGAFTMTSCKKNYTCVCTANGTSSEVTTPTKVSKATAKTWCEAYNTTGSGVSCKLK
jgi:predicted small secreted protein